MQKYTAQFDIGEKVWILRVHPIRRTIHCIRIEHGKGEKPYCMYGFKRPDYIFVEWRNEGSLFRTRQDLRESEISPRQLEDTK